MISTAIFLPLLGMGLLLLLPARVSRYWAALVQAVALVALAPLNGVAERAEWIPSLGIHYSLQVDGISWLLMLLTGITGLVAVLASWESVRDREKAFYALLLILQSAMQGVFAARDLILFFVFFEFTLVPMYFLIGLWGGERRLYAAIKFFLYTLAGSVLMLVAILALYFESGAGSFDGPMLVSSPLSPAAALWIFLGFLIAFAVKVPMFPFHTWLPDAHTEAPTAGSVLLAAVLLKMGTYGMLRFGLPLLGKAAYKHEVTGALAALSIVAILYGALVSLAQTDWKRLVAYSSVSHLGFCTLGLFSLNRAGLEGSVLQQLNHGISSALLFLIVGIAYERRHTRAIAEYGGLAHSMHRFATFFFIAVLSSAGVPLLNGFVGEFTILNGAYQASPAWAWLAVPGIVLGAAYLLWLYQRTMLGPVTNPANASLADLSPREWAVLLPLTVWAFAIGIYPKPYFDLIEEPVARILAMVHASGMAAR
jgi:NADH-quinone oxidoreductase subunit M